MNTALETNAALATEYIFLLSEYGVVARLIRTTEGGAMGVTSFLMGKSSAGVGFSAKFSEDEGEHTVRVSRNGRGHVFTGSTLEALTFIASMT